jgi:catechol 2,3-dioxygenase-like lactoylglutathione lyase family enzyme
VRATRRAALAAPLLAAGPAAAAEAVTRLGRAAFFVHDLATSLALYEGVLGMAQEPYSQPIRSKTMSDLFGFDAEALIDVRVLNGAGQRIGLMQRLDAPSPPTGTVALLFSTGDLEAVHAGFQRLGLTITRPPLARPAHQPDAVYARGPSGEGLIVTRNVLR